MDLKTLRQEAQLLSEHSPQGANIGVAEDCEISIAYLGNIRRLSHKMLDNEENRKLVKKIIKAYRKRLRKHQQEISKVLAS